MLDAGHRLLPFAMFDPARAVAQQLAALEPIISRIHGLKTQSTVLRSPVRALLDQGRPLMDLAAAHDLPVLFHTSINDPWAHVSDCLAVASAFPAVRFHLAHSCRFHAPLLRACAAMPNVWVDCSAHLAHCELARADSPVVASADDRVYADYTRPEQVLAAIFDLLGGRYMWGSDHPFMSWCDDTLRLRYTYGQEIAVVRALPESIQLSMLSTAPRAWLTGGKEPG